MTGHHNENWIASNLKFCVILGISLVSCERFVPKISPSKDKKILVEGTVEHLISLLDEEESIVFKDPSNPRGWALSSELIPIAVRSLVWMASPDGSTLTRSEQARICTNFSSIEVWTCAEARTMYADDTAHITESESYSTVPFICGQPIYLKDKNGRPARGLVRAAIGEPGKMHSFEYQQITEAKTFADGSLVIPCGPVRKLEHVLFAIFNDNLGFRKHSWVVGEQRMDHDSPSKSCRKPTL